MNIFRTKKFRYGSVSLGITIVIIAAVILLNAIVTALTGKFGWYIDMTPEHRFTLSQDAIDLLDEKMDTSREVEIILCAPEDEMEAYAPQLDVLETIRDLTNRYDNIKRKHVDYLTNPSAVQKYDAVAAEPISSSSVIVACGENARVLSLSAFFALDETESSIVGYNGEQRLVSAILSVTQTKMPIGYIAVHKNNGELTSTDVDYTGIKSVMQDAGFDVRFIDLRTEQISEDARLLVIYDPQEDLVEKSALSDISETDKLDDFLANDRSVMVFFDQKTGSLPNLEAFMEEWGITVARDGEANYYIQDTSSSADTEGRNIYAEREALGLGGSLTKRVSEGKTIIFPNTSAIKVARNYNWQYDDDKGYWSGYYYSNNVSRDIYNVFVSSDKAVATANGSVVKEADGKEVFSYMTVTCQTRKDAEGINHYSYVLACASTDFASTAALDTSYGNRKAMVYACDSMGLTVVPVALDCKYYADNEINVMTAEAANQYTIVLTVIPASLIFAAGIYIMVRRRYR